MWQLWAIFFQNSLHMSCISFLSCWLNVKFCPKDHHWAPIDLSLSNAQQFQTCFYKAFWHIHCNDILPLDKFIC